jgi:hypothetical protein
MRIFIDAEGQAISTQQSATRIFEAGSDRLIAVQHSGVHWRHRPISAAGQGKRTCEGCGGEAPAEESGSPIRQFH